MLAASGVRLGNGQGPLSASSSGQEAGNLCPGWGPQTPGVQWLQPFDPCKHGDAPSPINGSHGGSLCPGEAIWDVEGKELEDHDCRHS